MNTGKLVRMNRLFSHASGRLCSVAVDHFINYGEGLPPGLRHLRSTLAAIVAGQPDAVTMHKGIAASFWTAHAGRVPFILQSSAIRPDDQAREQIAEPADAVRLGADGFAIAAFVRGPTEAAYLRTVADCVRQAAAFEMPVICHIYPRNLTGDKTSFTSGTISFAPEDIAWAVRCAVEVGVDVVKTPYCGDVQAYAPNCRRLPRTLGRGRRAQGRIAPRRPWKWWPKWSASGARGATIGRNIWGFEHIEAAVRAFKAVIHDGKSPGEALRQAGLAESS